LSVYVPTVRFAIWNGDEHWFHEPPLNEHSKFASSLAEKWIVALVLRVVGVSTVSIVVTGSVVSGGGWIVHV
jgi:hypothetical protein